MFKKLFLHLFLLISVPTQGYFYLIILFVYVILCIDFYFEKKIVFNLSILGQSMCFVPSFQGTT